jgi:hypothetical protein
MSEIRIQEPDAPGDVKGRMLPGVAGIAVFLLVFTLMNVFGALQNAFGPGRNKYAVLALCSMLVAGLFGLLRMRRWGWAIVLAGCLLLSAGDFYFFRLAHQPFFLIRAFFMLIFFLYLVRPEVRDRML